MGVHLREKKLGNGQISFYLDIYHNKKRWYEFLEIHINKNKPSENDKEKKRLANEIRSQRENELIVQDNGLVDKNKRKADFVIWFDNHIKNKTKQNAHNASALNSLKKYLGKKPLPFTVILFLSFGFINVVTDYRDARVGSYFCHTGCNKHTQSTVTSNSDTATIVVSKDSQDSILQISYNGIVTKVKLVNDTMMSYPIWGKSGGVFYSSGDSIKYGVTFGRAFSCNLLGKKN